MLKIGSRVSVKGRVGTVRTTYDFGYDRPPQYGVVFDTDKKQEEQVCEAADVKEYQEPEATPEAKPDTTNPAGDAGDGTAR